MNHRYDLIIIGNGILANTVAFLVQQCEPALRVALIGPKDRFGSASQAAGAMLNVFGEIEPGALAQSMQRYKLRLAREALELWPSWYARLAEAAGAKNEPGVVPGTTILRPAGDATAYQSVRAALDAAREPYVIVDPRSLAGYRPAAEPATEAIHVPAEGRLDPRRLLVLFARIFERSLSVSTIDGTVSSIVIEQSALKAVRLSSGDVIAAPKVLVAAGAQSGRLMNGIPQLRDRIQRVLYGIGVALVFETEGTVPPYVLRVHHPGFDHGIYLVPQNRHEIYIGATSDISPVPERRPRAGRIEALRQAGATCFDRSLMTTSFRTLFGYRPVTQDRLPLIGETSVLGLFLLTGTGRDGLHLSPIYAQDMADRILTGKGFLCGFEPERIAARTTAAEDGGQRDFVDFN